MRKRSKRQGFSFKVPPTFLKWGVSLVSLSLVLWGALWASQWFSDPSNMPLEHVVIHAPYRHVSQGTLERHIAPYVKKSFVTMNALHLQSELQGLPWVKKIQLQRVWPDTLVVTVVEQQPFARWGVKGVLNNEGGIFFPELASIPPGLPAFNGPVDMAKTILENYKQFQAALAKSDLKVTAVNVNSRHAWELELEGGTLVKLGQGQYHERLALVVKVWPSLTEGRTTPLKMIDARYPKGIAVK